MSREAADNIINGRFPTQMIPLGGAEYRKAYEDLSLQEEQAEIFQTINKFMTKYPYAVVTRNELYYKSDDNCSVISDTMGGVDVSEACRNHDYCFRRLISPMNSDAAYADFTKCNNMLSEEIVKICKENGKECSLGKVYEMVLRNVSYLVFRKRQGNQAEMMKNLIVVLKDKPELLRKFMATNVFNFPQMLESYQRYCTKSQKSYVMDTNIMAMEKNACEKSTIIASQTMLNEMSLASLDPAL